MPCTGWYNRLIALVCNLVHTQSTHVRLEQPNMTNVVSLYMNTHTDNTDCRGTNLLCNDSKRVCRYSHAIPDLISQHN